MLGRQRERDVLARALKAARDGQSGVLTGYGEAGVGQDRTARVRGIPLPLEGR
ncbi:MAG TPA: hypothetical protein VH300_01250 [Thermoleophilaceae bacterium]|nr:hypothetical protein [Thermoleophilaceae bacterium]